METLLGLTFILPILGLLVMVVMRKAWQNAPGWLMASYIGLPGFEAVLALLASVPLLIVGVLFILDIAAANKK